MIKIRNLKKTRYVLFVEIDNEENGYYTGKHVRKNGEDFPVVEKKVTERTKTYATKIEADDDAEKAFYNCKHVDNWKIEEDE